jgi:putative ABC transport system permease protein
VRARVALYAEPLAIGRAFGLLVSLLFALLPLMRARRVSAATLMRGAVVAGGRLGWRDALLIGACLALAAFTISPPTSRRIAAGSCWARSAPSSPFRCWRGLMAWRPRAGKPRLAGFGWRSPIFTGPARQRPSSCCRWGSASPCWWRRR